MTITSQSKRRKKQQNDTNSLVEWFDSIIPSKPIESLAYKNVAYFKKCLCGSLTLNVGDYILVLNADAKEPDTVSGCDVAKILYLFELRETSKSDQKCRAIIQWYSRPEDLSQRHFDTDDITVDFDYEIIEDHRYQESDITLTSIYGKCRVIYAHTKNTAREILAAIKSNKNTSSTSNPMFVCRYKLVRDSKKHYQLVPVQTDDHAKAKPNAEKEEEEENAAEKNNQNATRNATNAVEFLDMAYFSNQHKVSPIRIVGGRNVVRVTSISKQTTPTTCLTKVNATITPKSQQSAVCRNLNLGLEEPSPDDIDYLNYSIVKPSVANVEHETTNDMKLKLRVSKRQSTSAYKQQQAEEPLKKKFDKEITIPMEKTPSPPRTRRKSILRSATTRNAEGTPKRSIQLSNIVEQCVFSKEDIISTPKRSRRSETPIISQKTPQSTRTRRRTIVCVVDDSDEDVNYNAYTPVKRTPAKSITKQNQTPTVKKTPTRRNTPCVQKTPNKCQTPSQKLRALRSGEICPALESRTPTSKVDRRKSNLQLTCKQLHVGSVPNSLPCREKEFDNIYSFLRGKIKDECGGCMYVSGVPGTGKTATVTSVISVLQHEMKTRKLPPFEFLAINGMRLTEPRQAYVHIYRQLTGKMMPWEQAYTLLDKRFNTTSAKRLTTILLVDELDILCNRRQDVVYNLLDWPTKSQAHLVVITIANTMDLPERLLMGKVNSRLGLTRLTFQPYTHKQLQEIVSSRLAGSSSFKNEAIQLVARKVAAVSGDARRALDICRRATEMAEYEYSNQVNKSEQVNMQHVQMALNEMIASAKVQAIKSCSHMEQLFLEAMVAESNRTGVEETSFMSVYTQVETLSALKGLKTPIVGQMLRICSQLGSRRLIICEHSRNDIFQKLLLNVSMDDVYYALQVQHATD